MAEACRFGNSHSETKSVTNHDENFCIFNIFCVFISLVTILADLTTDLLVFAEYCKNGTMYWAVLTLIFIVVPNVLINIFSMRWIALDKRSTLRHWIMHCCFIGLLERYITFLRDAFTCKSLGAVKTQKLVPQHNDLSLLHFLYTFTGTVPQIVLQSYAIVALDENYHTKAFALTASTASVVWACATYIYSITSFDNEHFQWYSVLLKLIWHFGMLMARIAGILLFTVIFGIWTLVPLGLHWAAMTFWIVTQKTTFCPNKLEETFYNVVMGFVYCFCYINLREGHTRYRLLTFYTLMVTQNFGSLFLYVIVADLERQKKGWSVLATVCIVAGTLVGMCGMILYYRWFHEKGPIAWKNVQEDIELNNKVTNPKNNNGAKGLGHVRSFKSQKDPIQKTQRNDTSLPNHIQQSEIAAADKKFLLDHLIARAGTPTFVSAPVGNSSLDASVQIYTLENTPQSLSHPIDDIALNQNKVNIKAKKKSICLSELTLKLSSLETIESSIDELTTSTLNLHKRRGICSSDELRDDLNLELDACNADVYNKSQKNSGSEISHDTDGSNKKTSSDSIDMDLELSFSDINSSDINTFNENIVQKLCLSALKNIKVGNQDADIQNIQRIALDILKEMYAKKGRSLKALPRDLDTPTELLSVHDYENICAVNIAREAWGLRSWNGYCDIESRRHDGSVVRDRRRDTLTSASSDASSQSTYCDVPPHYANAAAVCRDDSCRPLAADQLEPILEELDDLEPDAKRLNSESSLVATIDEIRKATISSSPRNLYHRRDRAWDSPQFSSSHNMETNLKRALWKEPSKLNTYNIMESFPEKENILDVNRPKLGAKKKELNVPVPADAIELNASQEIATYDRNMSRRRAKSNNLREHKKVNNAPGENTQDLSNRDIDFLWKLVSDNSLPTSSAEDLTSTQITSSLQSLILRDAPSNSVMNSFKNTNMKKSGRSKPRRKFSILRERFEPSLGRGSDEEILYHYSENSAPPIDASVVNVKNQINSTRDRTDLAAANKRINSQSATASNTHPTETVSSKDFKDKRSLFMKQVLSPPKLNTKLKYKT